MLLNRFIKYTLKIFALIIGILIIVYVIAFIYVSSHKKAIIKDVTESIGKKINGNVSIGNVELSFFKTFPKISVLLHNVIITDTMYAMHHHPIFKADDVFAQLSVMELIEKKFPVNGLKIENASVYLFTDANGYTNQYLLKPKRSDTASSKIKDNSSAKNNLENLELKNFLVIIDDRKREKLLDIFVDNLKVKLDDEDEATIFSAKANMLIKNLAFYIPNGSFAKGKIFEGDFNFKFDKKHEQLQFDSINIKLSGQPFNVTAKFDLVKPDPQFMLRIHARQLSYSSGKSLLTLKIDSSLSIVDLDKKFDADAYLEGPMNGGDPYIFVNWSVKDVHLVTPFLDFDNASFTGFYTDEVAKGLPRRDPNSAIIIKNFTGKWNAMPFSSAHIDIINLAKPLLNCDLVSDFPLTKLNETLGSNSFQFQSGNGAINLTYNGPIEKNNNSNSFINGNISFKNGNILYVPRNVELKNLSGEMEIKNSDVLIENIQCNVLNNFITMNGRANNLISLINTQPNNADIDWNIYSPSLNLTGFTYLLKSRAKTVHKASGAGLGKVSDGIDNVLNQGRVHVNLKTPHLIYKKFEASDASITATLFSDRYEINNVSMSHGGGRLGLTGSLTTTQDNYHQAKANVTLTDIDINKLFTAFNNFGQTGIEAKNLEGKLTATANATLILDDDGKALPNSIQSNVDFSLKDGALNHYEPIKKIQSFAFKNRNFDNIRFAELKDHLDIANNEIKINRMEIQSTVLVMFVEGVYSMKGNTDLSIQIPFSNLKKRDSAYVPVNEGVDKKAGASLFIKAKTGSDGNVQFRPEIFHLFKRSRK